MGDIIAGTLKNDPAKTIVRDAEKWFGRPQGKADWTEVPLKKTGDWFYAFYEKVSDRDDAIPKYFAKQLRDRLNEWCENPSMTDKVKSASTLFGELLDKIGNITALGAKAGIEGKDAQAFRSAGFSIMMALGAGYESGLNGDDFKETFAKTRLAERSDRVHERYGGPPKDFQIDVNEDPATYWESKRPAEADHEILDQIKEDLQTLEKPSSASERTRAFDRLGRNLDQVTGSKLEERGVMGMLTVEAFRKPLGCLRKDQPDSGELGSRVASKSLKGKDYEKLSELSRQNRIRYERRRPEEE